MFRVRLIIRTLQIQKQLSWVFLQNMCFWNFWKIHRKRLCRILFFNKKITHRCFLGNLAKFYKRLFFWASANGLPKIVNKEIMKWKVEIYFYIGLLNVLGASVAFLWRPVSCLLMEASQLPSYGGQSVDLRSGVDWLVSIWGRRWRLVG